MKYFQKDVTVTTVEELDPQTKASLLSLNLRSNGVMREFLGNGYSPQHKEATTQERKLYILKDRAGKVLGWGIKLIFLSGNREFHVYVRSDYRKHGYASLIYRRAFRNDKHEMRTYSFFRPKGRVKVNYAGY